MCIFFNRLRSDPFSHQVPTISPKGQLFSSKWNWFRIQLSTRFVVKIYQKTCVFLNRKSIAEVRTLDRCQEINDHQKWINHLKQAVILTVIVIALKINMEPKNGSKCKGKSSSKYPFCVPPKSLWSDFGCFFTGCQGCFLGEICLWNGSSKLAKTFVGSRLMLRLSPALRRLCKSPGRWHRKRMAVTAPCRVSEKT